MRGIGLAFMTIPPLEPHGTPLEGAPSPKRAKFPGIRPDSGSLPLFHVSCMPYPISGRAASVILATLSPSHPMMRNRTSPGPHYSVRNFLPGHAETRYPPWISHIGVSCPWQPVGSHRDQ